MNRTTANPITRCFIPVVAITASATCFAAPGALSASDAAVASTIPAWVQSHAHAQPLVAVVGANAGTELVDFVIPYGILKRAGVETVALSTQEGPLHFRPALKAQPDGTTAQFDARHPEGADYVIVPAVANSKDPVLLAWISAQSRKGATVVSICDGAMVVGNAGLLEGKWATAHWASESQRRQHFPTTHWVRNTRYVADGNVVSSAGISAAMPTTIALVEAIAGTERATALAREMEIPDWSPRHDSDAFRPHYGNLRAFAVKLAINPLLRGNQTIGVPLAPGVDEITLAVAADAYSRTGRSHALSIAPTASPVASRHGLVFLPDVVGASKTVDVVLPQLMAIAPGKVFDTTLAGIAERFGRRTAYGVALDFEYPGYTP